MPMLRLALMLGAAIYAALVIVPERVGDAVPPVDVARASLGIDATTPARPAEGSTLMTADGRALPIAAVIDPAAIGNGPEQIARISTSRPETVSASGSGGAQELPLVEVTGGYVNLRAGPSTDDPVLGAMAGGEQAELIAALDSGWVQIRVLSTGVEGYMSDSFVTPVN